MARENPFTPSFGVTPPLLVGREDFLDDFGAGLDDGPGALERSTLFVGVRGVGKTVMLNAAQAEAESRGWVVISDTARENLLESLTKTRIPAALQLLDPESFENKSSLGAASVAGFSATKHVSEADREAPVADLRAQLEELCALTEQGGTGVLISIDEIHRSATEAMRELAVAFQHLRREDRNIAFVGAGLPVAIEDIGDDDIVTFLRRSSRNDLGKVDLQEIRQALKVPALQAGRPFDSDALDLATAATNGYPFMIQLVGSYCFRTNQESDIITAANAQVGIERAQRRVGSLVFGPEVNDLTEIEKSFITAMAVDDGLSEVTVVGERLGLDANNARVHRHNLIGKQVIESPKRGFVTFSNEAFRDYLRSTAAFVELDRKDN